MRRVGEQAYLLDTGSAASALVAYASLDSAEVPGVVEIVPGADSLLVVFSDAPDAECERQLAAVERSSRGHAPQETGSEHVLEVVYDGPDLEDVAVATSLTVDGVIERHASASYRVAFVGFQPGFAYLSGLPEALATPRRATPRPRIPAGSVAIGGEWTGVYPAESPGGWQLIGTSRVSLFDPAAEPPARLLPGDRVRFVAR